MTRLHRVATTLILWGALAPIATAQTPPPAPAPGPGPVDQAPRISRDSSRTKNPASHLTPTNLRRRSIVHHYPYPYPGYYHSDDSAGFRNPGHVGRFDEFYPAGDHFQVEKDPVRVASFDRGGGPDRQEQMAAQQIGIQRYNAIQSHIDRYARPYFGFGYGVGFFGGYY